MPRRHAVVCWHWLSPPRSAIPWSPLAYGSPSVAGERAMGGVVQGGRRHRWRETPAAAGCVAARVSLEARRASLTLSLRDHPQVAVRLHAHKRLVRAPTLPLSPALLRRALPPSLGVTLGFVAGGGTRGGCGTCGVRSGCHLCVRAACGASSLPDCAHKNVVHPHTTPSTCRSTAGRVQRCPPGGSVLRGAHPP